MGQKDRILTIQYVEARPFLSVIARSAEPFAKLLLRGCRRSMLTASLVAMISAMATQRSMQQLVQCTSIGFPDDLSYEACYPWCPKNPIANCPRCKCRACAVCPSPPPPAPPWGSPVAPPMLVEPPPPPLLSPPPAPSLSPTSSPPPPSIPCSSGIADDISYQACYSWCPNNPGINCPRCK